MLANIWAVHHDPHIWEEPFDFNPYRFLSDDGKALIEHEGFMPFSLGKGPPDWQNRLSPSGPLSGKRSCVAESFVRKLLLIYFVSIVQKFSVHLPDGGKEAFEEEFNITLRPKGNVKLVFQLRNETDI